MKRVIYTLIMVFLFALSSCTIKYGQEHIDYIKAVNAISPNAVTFTYDDETTTWGRVQSFLSAINCKLFKCTNEYIEAFNFYMPYRWTVSKEKSNGVLRIVIQQLDSGNGMPEHNREWQLKAFYYYLKTGRYNSTMILNASDDYNNPDNLPRK